MKKQILGVLTALSFTALPALAQQEPDVMVVFDASGSMWGQIDGRTKIEIARDAFVNLSADWATSDANVGLIAYGHRRKRDCGDIELIAMPEQGSTARLGALVQGLTPRGKTPLSDAVRMAAQELKYTENAATVVLLSDGRETCGVNVCEAGAELEKLGVDFTAHVIGFDVSDTEARGQLQCLAQNTGGQYFDASNAGALAEALGQVVSLDAPIAKPQKAAVPMVALNIGIIEADGTARPVQVSFRAFNLDNDEVVVLGMLRDAKEVVTGLKESLPQGRWRIEALSEEGFGSIEVTLNGERADVDIPFAAFPLDFTLIDNGPYLLGVEQTMLLFPTANIQKNLQLKVAMFPAGSNDPKQRMDFSYRFGAKAGQMLEHRFDSPPAAGNYDIVIMSGNDPSKAIFRQTVTYASNIEPLWFGERQGGIDGRLEVKISGVTSALATLVLQKDGSKVVSNWFASLISDEGIFIPLPSEEGEYSLIYKYKNAAGERVEADFGTIIVGSVVLEDDADAVAPPTKSAEQNNASPTKIKFGYWQMYHALSGEVITGVGILDDISNAEMTFRESSISHLGRGEFLLLQDFAFVNGNVEISYETEFGIAKGVLKPTKADYSEFKGIMATSDGKISAPVSFSYYADIALSAQDHGEEPTEAVAFDVSYLCNQRFCEQEAPEFDLTWALPKGWSAEEPYYYASASGIEAELPTMVFYAPNSQFVAVLNPTQWVAGNGGCYQVTRGEFCVTQDPNDDDFYAFNTLLNSLRDAPLKGTSLSETDIEKMMNKTQ